MKLQFFNKAFKLNDVQSEVLKIAILDALRYANDEQANFDESSKEYTVIANKIKGLDDLANLLGLTHE